MTDESRSLQLSLINESQYQFKVPLRKKSPKPGLLSRLCFAWVIPILRLANRTTLEAEMIDDLSSKNTAQYLEQRFYSHFLGRAGSKNILFSSLLLTFRGTFVCGCLLVGIGVALQMCMPLLVRRVIFYIQRDTKTTTEGVVLILLIFGTRFCYVLVQSHANAKIRRFGYDAISAISMALLRKCTKVSFLSNKQHPMGEVINLLQVDTTRLKLVAKYLLAVIFMPLQIGGALYLVYDFIGVSFVGGCAVIAFTGLLNYCIASTIWWLQRGLMTSKDERTKQTNELFSQIKSIKINAYEDHFITKILRARATEMKWLRKRILLGCVNVLLFDLSPMLIINSTIAIYIYLGNNLNAADTFTLISLFQSLQGPLHTLPKAFNSLIEANVSMRRIQRFLLTQEIMTDCITQGEDAVRMMNGNFYWGCVDEQRVVHEHHVNPSTSIMDVAPTLKQLNLRIERGEFVSIVGDVGVGKSSLLQALIGEMIYDVDSPPPLIMLKGSIAYVSQKPWIQNATLRENILFGKPFNEARYREALKYSCLASDIYILVRADLTMIGEKGVNLSGGQKARISLARAIYSDSDIYLLDDPISAVDVHVGRFIMHKCFNGILKNKTRILVTHALNYCQYTDYVYLMEDGRITEGQKYDQIKHSQKFQRVYQSLLNPIRRPVDSKEEIEEAEMLLLQQEEVLEKQDSQRRLASNRDENSPPRKMQKMQKQRDDIDTLMLIEDRVKGGISWDTLRSYFRANGGLLFFLFITLITFSQVSSQIAASLWLAYWVDDPKLGNVMALQVFSSFSVSYGIFSFTRLYLLAWQCTKSADFIHHSMINCLAYAPQCQFFERVPLGRIVNRFTKDQGVLDMDIYWSVALLYLELVTLLGNTFLNIYASTLYIIIPVVAFVAAGWWMQRVYMKAQREFYRLEGVTKSPILSYFTETVNGMPTVRAYHRTEDFMMVHAQHINVNRKIQLQQLYTNAWFQMMLTYLSFIVNMSAITFCVFYSHQNPAFAGLLMTYASSLNENIQSAIQASSVFETQIISFERCLAYTRVKPEPAYTDLVRSRLTRTKFSEPQIDLRWPQQGRIEFRNYSVRYREGMDPALRQLSLIIEPNQTIGIVGRTGAGKSTITMGLLRILESITGCILIDGIDISMIGLKQLRQSITMIQQDPSLFEGTLRQNIDPLNKHSPEAVLDALSKCNLSGLLQRDQGMDTWVAEGGENLSSGERQLVCIARAILKRTRIVLIDEATANIDIETEQKIQAAILEGFRHCTVLTIAHRINTILHCDKILVIERGKLREFGNTRDLLNDKGSLFYNVYQEVLKDQALN